MIEFIKDNKLPVALILIIVLLLAYQFLYMSKEKAALIVYNYSSGVDWEAGYLRARAKAINHKKDSFKFKGEEYDTSTGKKRV